MHMQSPEVDWFDNYRPSRIQMVPLKLRSIYYKGSTSTPFVSGDAIANLSDMHIQSLPLNSTSVQKLRNSKVIFVDSELFLQFSATHAIDLLKKSTLITGNGDFDVTSVPDFVFEKDIRWFAQNLMIPELKKVHALPAGIENLDYGRNGLPKNLRFSNLSEATDDRILFGPFGDTHPTRRLYLKFALDHPEVFFVPQKRVEPAKMFRITKKFKFVFCPRGNGFDSHRVWETLYRGRIPIVEASAWSKSMKNLGFPILEVDNLLEMQPRLLKEFHSMTNEVMHPSQYEALWMPYWHRKIHG
jgi:hypothetical protein